MAIPCLVDAWIMVSRSRDRSTSPAQLGGKTQSLTVIVEELEAHFDRSGTNGTKIIEELHETVYGELQ
jgi:uncharacterized glyoxalase superfamily protein PhnB